MPASPTESMRPLPREQLREQFRDARPFPHFCIDGFLDDGFAREVAASLPSFEQAASVGRVFRSVNERLKLQLTDADAFPAPVRALHDLLASPAFLSDLSYVTGIPDLLADPQLIGGGIHQTGPGGRLDVHVDFNLLEDRPWHRRLNILVYLNEPWQEDWGGRIELWDERVRECQVSLAPILNRCVVFETSERSYHGVTPLTAPAGVVRKSFAAYYYTVEPPAGWDGRAHSTIFRARPGERFRGWVAMPLEKLGWRVRGGVARLKRGVKRALGRR